MQRSNPSRRRPHRPGNRANSPHQGPEGAFWLYGTHAVLAAIRNKNRKILQILAADGPAAEVRQAISIVEGRDLPAVGPLDLRSMPQGIAETAVHQGLLAQVLPLPEADPNVLTDLSTTRIVALDQVTDPQNVGAILRNCAVFGVDAIIAPRHHTPRESGALAKAASGALEIVPILRVANLARALEQAKKDGFFVIGLDGDATNQFGDYAPLGRCVLVAGAEGRGLRRLVGEYCDATVALPVDARARAAGVDSLNVAAAVAVALHELVRHQ